MTLVARVLNWKGRYRMAGKFGGNLIWRISLQFHLAVLFLRAMMSYVIATWRVHVRNLNAPPSSNIRSRGNMEAELCIESWTFLDKSFEKCLTAFAGPCSAANFPICALSSGVYCCTCHAQRYSLLAHASLLRSFFWLVCLKERGLS